MHYLVTVLCRNGSPCWFVLCRDATDPDPKRERGQSPWDSKPKVRVENRATCGRSPPSLHLPACTAATLLPRMHTQFAPVGAVAFVRCCAASWPSSSELQRRRADPRPFKSGSPRVIAIMRYWEWRAFAPACCHISVRCTIDLELLESNCQSLALRIAPAAEIRESSSQQLGRLSPSSVPLRDASQGKVCVIKTDVQGSKAM